MNRESKSCLILLCALAAAAPGLAAAQAGPQAKPQAAELVGRLFFTPAQRASLDVARSRRARATLSTEQPEEAAPIAQSVTYHGMVRRSDGKTTMWVNNRAVHDDEAATGAIVGRVRPDGGITLSLPQSGRSVDLKPGQSIELLSGTVEEGYSRKPEPAPAAKAANAKPATKPQPPEQARTEDVRRSEERERQRIEEAVERTLQDSGASRGAPPSPAQAAERPR